MSWKTSSVRSMRDMRAVSLDSSRLPASKGLMSASLLVPNFVCSGSLSQEAGKVFLLALSWGASSGSEY